jgi:hypothetical protein
MTADDVPAFVAALSHPHEAEILALHRFLLDADPRVGEGIKWNAPSYRTTEWFATTQPRAKEGVQLILHFGATRRPGWDARTAVADPAGLLEWLGPDRASVRFRDPSAIETARDAPTALVRSWIAHV